MLKNNTVTEFLDFNRSLANMKDVDYKNTLAITALIELLIDKGFITKDDFSSKAQKIEYDSLTDIVLNYRQNNEK